ncbi:hypothetical protein XIS1_460117 [Xenorhabdus innexi]|uniref:Uncharacterized protein n=1 Tax=Xenorhabdus innexi TaxID=290109 RepID=A0A1N6MYB0_9GAMM|nr:hypothetical protein XIS1_460117 [Xenorhabdus innexi]
MRSCIKWLDVGAKNNVHVQEKFLSLYRAFPPILNNQCFSIQPFDSGTMC